MNKYSDQTLQGESFALLPVETFNKIMWRSGDDRLPPLLETDPGQFLGEFRSMVEMPATNDREAVIFPVLPWRIVKRKSGRETYQRYSTTEMLFRPIAARLRYVLFARDAANQVIKDENGRKVILAVTKNFVPKSGYEPQKEVFGIVYDDKGEPKTYALLVLDSWNAYISYDRAAKVFEKIAAPEGQLPLYRIGTRGTKDSDGNLTTKYKNFNGKNMVEIEALDADKPMFVTIDEEFDRIWEKAQEWVKCPRWNSEKMNGAEVQEAPQAAHFDAINGAFEAADNDPFN